MGFTGYPYTQIIVVDNALLCLSIKLFRAPGTVAQD